MLPPRRERKRMFNEGLTERRPIPEKKRAAGKRLSGV